MHSFIKVSNQLSYKPYWLQFKQPAGTSRGVLKQKKSYIIQHKLEQETIYAECGVLEGLSIDDHRTYESALQVGLQSYEQIGAIPKNLRRYPSILMGLEQLERLSLMAKPDVFFDNAFSRGQDSMLINGLIWMGDVNFMRQQIEEKIAAGFTCIKMKIGAINWQQELDSIALIRSIGGPSLTIRVDANGAWGQYHEAIQKLHQLHPFNIHSIEQPLPVNHPDYSKICKESPFPVALDEELFEHATVEQKKILLEKIKPQFIVLKPSLTGGFSGTSEWINIARSMNIGFWITSALESNIGLNAIAQYCYENQLEDMYQGLGTGSLYTNNFDSPITIQGENISFNPSKTWDYSNLHNNE